MVWKDAGGFEMTALLRVEERDQSRLHAYPQCPWLINLDDVSKQWEELSFPKVTRWETNRGIARRIILENRCGSALQGLNGVLHCDEIRLGVLYTRNSIETGFIYETVKHCQAKRG
jgi:hypothetical protein